MSTTAKRKASKRPSLPPPRLISPDAFKEIAVVQNFPPGAGKAILGAINQSLQDIRWRMSNPTSTEREEVGQLSTLVVDLDGLSARLKRLQRGAQGRMSNAVRGLFSRSLSKPGVERELPELARRVNEKSRPLPDWGIGEEQAWTLGLRMMAPECLREIVQAAADRLREAITDYKKSPAAKGGGRRQVWRQRLIIDLVDLYRAYELTPTSTKNGPFATFVTDVLYWAGWPTDGVSDGVLHALAEAAIRDEILWEQARDNGLPLEEHEQREPDWDDDY
jgi:hypothetical protein